MARRIIIKADPEAVAREAAVQLVERLVACQAKKDIVHVCLTGGRIANQMYAEFSKLAAESDFDPKRVELWWGDEAFVPTADPHRNAGKTLGLLARHLTFDSSRTHLMPAANLTGDPESAARSYAEDLGDTWPDVTLLGIGVDGHVASIFPNHPSSDPTTRRVIGVTECPQEPYERISMTVPTINSSPEVWLLAVGSEKAWAVAEALTGNTDLPVGQVHGEQRTVWFLDAEAASQLPRHTCDW